MSNWILHTLLQTHSCPSTYSCVSCVFVLNNIGCLKFGYKKTCTSFVFIFRDGIHFIFQSVTNMDLIVTSSFLCLYYSRANGHKVPNTGLFIIQYTQLQLIIYVIWFLTSRYPFSAEAIRGRESCSRMGPGEVRTPELSVTRRTLYHWATTSRLCH
jgi:hypothetical protein